MTTTSKPVTRRLHGFLLLDKPVGMSSNQALQKTKRLLRAHKAGHTGSLDPIASGLLPICMGEATKFAQFLLEADKSYIVTAKLGERTTTSDSEGEVIERKPVPEFTPADIEKALAEFRGEILQVPSMYSALKYNGQPLYKLARQGITVEREARSITIYECKLLELTAAELKLHVVCSKGTYVRTLIDDLGETLGCGAHVIGLRRLTVGPFKADQMHTLSELTENEAAANDWLLPIVVALDHLPAVTLSTKIAFYLRQGQTVMTPNLPADGTVRLQLADGSFIGVGEVLGDGRVAPKRLIKSN